VNESQNQPGSPSGGSVLGGRGVHRGSAPTRMCRDTRVRTAVGSTSEGKTEPIPLPLLEKTSYCKTEP